LARAWVAPPIEFTAAIAHALGKGGHQVTRGRVVIFANGLLPESSRAGQLVHAGDFIIGADGGTHHALRLGVTPAVVVGDLDSLAAADRAALANSRVELVQHPRDKDETDLELAVQYAMLRKPSALVIVGGLGSRLDHTIGNLSMLTDARLERLDCRLDDGQEAAFFCRSRSTIRGNRGDLVSLLPWGRDAVGVRTFGLRWALHGETLRADRTRGLSNELLGISAEVRVDSGLLLIVHRRLI
jgi:thiamine pyrophosphokinase